MSIDKIKQLSEKLKKTAENSETFFTSLLGSKLKKAATEYPHDNTLVMMSNTINKLADKQALINRGDIKKLYNQFYVRNTKCAEVLKDELMATELVGAKLYNRSGEIGEIAKVNNALDNALASVFSNEPLKTYSDVSVVQAKKALSEVLGGGQVEVEAGNEKFLVLKANYETPKGLTGFYVPVEVKGEKVEASIFMGNSGPKELNKSNIKEYIVSNAGVKLVVKAADILNIITKATEEKREITDTELALARVKANRAVNAFEGQIVGQKLEEVGPGEVATKVAGSDKFAVKLASTKGIAEFTFGIDKLNVGAGLINRKLSSFGHRNANIKVAKCDKDKVFYAVSVNGMGFTVPVKMSKKVEMPGMMICNGSICEFNESNINKLQNDNVVDYKAMAVASPLYELGAGELVAEIKTAMSEDNVVRAEDALNTLKQKNDAAAYAIGFKAFTDGLSSKKVAQTSCSKIIKHSSSQQLICSHTGLPINKVYQDKHGNCLPSYNKNLEVSKPAFLQNYKIFG